MRPLRVLREAIPNTRRMQMRKRKSSGVIGTCGSAPSSLISKVTYEAIMPQYKPALQTSGKKNSCQVAIANVYAVNNVIESWILQQCLFYETTALLGYYTEIKNTTFSVFGGGLPL